MLPEDTERMVRFLGRDDPDVRRLLKIWFRNPGMAGMVRNLLKRRCRQAGFDPDDPPTFWPVRDLPPGVLVLGQVEQGSTPGPIVALSQETLTHHTGLFGQSGTGKSRLGMHVAAQVVEAGHRVWVLDVEDEYSPLVQRLPAGAIVALEPDDLRVNLFQPPGPWISTSQWLDEMILLLRGQMFLRDGSLNVFRLAMGQLLQRKGVTRGGTDWPSLGEVLEQFRGMSFGPKSRSAGYLESLLNRFTMLAAVFGQTARVTQSNMLPALANRSCVFRLQRLTGVPLQFLSGYLLVWLARYLEGAARHNLTHVVLIEEAHMFHADAGRMDIGPDVLCRTFRTARKRGIGLVLCDQVPSELPTAVLANLGCRVVMRLVSHRCLWSLQNTMGLNREQADAVPELRHRQAVVQYELHPTPFMVRIPELVFPGRPGEAALRAMVQDLMSEAQWQEHVPQVGRILSDSVAAAVGPDDLAGDALLVMVRILEHPDETIDERCNALGVDRAREFRARGEMCGRGFIEQASQTIGGKTRFFLPTAKGIQWAERHKVRVRRFKSGIVHEYLLSQVARQIGKLGPRWGLQRNSSVARDQGLQPDLLVLGPDGKRFIVEIVCHNVEYDAENIVAETAIPGIDKVIAVTPDRTTAMALEKALDAAAVLLDREPKPSFTTLCASECLSEKYDWGALLNSREESTDG